MKGISIIIPVYNREAYIAEAIQSVINQNYSGKLEIIISDDGSTDKTLEIAESYGNKVLILRKGKDVVTQGVSSTRNRGLRAATQEYIGFLDSDDFYLPGHLTRMVNVLDKETHLDFAFCRVLEAKEENGLKLFRPWTKQYINKIDIKYPVISDAHVVCTNSFLFRKNVFNKVGIFNENYSNHEDSDLWIRISEQHTGAFVNSFGAVYRVYHGGSQLTMNSIKQLRNCSIAVFRSAIDRYYKLGLNDSFRIFTLKHGLSNIKYRHIKIIHYLNYCLLVLRYPSAFLKRIPNISHRIFHKRRKSDWLDISHFINTIH